MTPNKRQHTDMSAADHHQLLEPSQALASQGAAGSMAPLTFSMAHQHGWDGHLDVHQRELHHDQDGQLHTEQLSLQDEGRLQQHHDMPPVGDADAEGAEEQQGQEQEQEQGGGGHVTAALEHVLLATVRQYFDTEVAPRTAEIEQVRSCTAALVHLLSC